MDLVHDRHLIIPSRCYSNTWWVVSKVEKNDDSMPQELVVRRLALETWKVANKKCEISFEAPCFTDTSQKSRPFGPSFWFSHPCHKILPTLWTLEAGSLKNELVWLLVEQYDSDRFHLQRYGNWFLAPKTFAGWTVHQNIILPSEININKDQPAGLDFCSSEKSTHRSSDTKRMAQSPASARNS